MKIKEGYNGKESEIKIISDENCAIQLWLVQTGLEGKASETLSYMTIEELHDLYQEVKSAGKKLFE